MSWMSLVLMFFGVVGVVWAVIAWRHRVTAPKLSRSNRGGDLGTRCVEGVALLGIGALVLMYEIRFQGLPGHFAEINTPLVRAWAWGVVAVAAGLVIVVAVGVAWRTWVSALLMIGWTMATIWVFDYGDAGFMQVAGIDRIEPHVTYTIAPNVEYPGVKLHVNGVYLGEAPVTMRIEEFESKVPYWPDPPDGLNEHELRSPEEQDVERPWTRFKSPEYNTDLRFFHQEVEARAYYAQIELNGEWGTGFGGGGGGSVRGLKAHYESGLSMRFAGYDQRIDEHIDAARDAGYTADSAWIERMELFGPRGWRLLRNRADREPALRAVMSAWAAERYDLAGVDTAAEAWAALERIDSSLTDPRGRIDDASLEAAALDRIVPLLDERQVADAAVRAMADDPFQFVYLRSPLGYVVRKMDERLDAEAAEPANVIETEVLTALVMIYRDDAEHNRALDTAEAMGWPYLYEFLIRRDWRRDVHTPWDDEAMSLGNKTYINAWLYRLLYLDSPEGRAFRSKHEYHVQQTADRIVEGAGDAGPNFDRLTFLFLDNDLGEESPAWQYWPRFKRLSRDINPTQGYWGLYTRFKYLSKMEPLSRIEQYVESLKMTTGEMLWVPADEALRDLPKARRIEIVEALIAELKRIAADPPEDRQLWMEPRRITADIRDEGGAGLLWRLERHLAKLGGER